MGFSVGNAKKANDIKAPMPGLILSVNVKEGQEVLKGSYIIHHIKCNEEINSFQIWIESLHKISNRLVRNEVLHL